MQSKHAPNNSIYPWTSSHFYRDQRNGVICTVFQGFFILSYTNIVNTDAAKCKKVQFVGLLDCSDLGLTELPKMDEDINVKVLELRKNNIKAITKSSLFAIFPNIVVVDLRENPLDLKKYSLQNCELKAIVQPHMYHQPRSV